MGYMHAGLQHTLLGCCCVGQRRASVGVMCAVWELSAAVSCRTVPKILGRHEWQG